MGQLTLWGFFVLTVLCLVAAQEAVACSCMPPHPQTLFCKSDYVAVVRVKWMRNVSDYDNAYGVKVNKVFKQWNTLNPDEFPKQNVLLSSKWESLCGVDLQVGDTYVVSGMVNGGKVRLSFCGIAKRWSEVSSRQRKGFRGLYHRGCACDIAFTPWWRKGTVLELAGRKRCLWESLPGPQDCQEKYGMCMPGPGGCSWIPSVPYKNCIKEHQQKREQQRLREP